MKIGFFAYSEYSLRPYFEVLKNSAQCTWGVFNWYLYHELRSRGLEDCSIVFFNNPLHLKLPPTINKFVNKCYAFLGVEPQQRISKLLISKIPADVWLTDTTLILNKMYHIKVPRVLVFHSITYKPYILDKETTDFELVLLPSEYFKQQLMRKFPQANPNKLRVVGWPRSDIYLKGIYSRESILKLLGLNPYKKTVLFAPTHNAFPGQRFFPEEWGDLGENFEIICKKMKELNLNFIVKLHSASHKIIANKNLRSIAEKYNALWYNDINKYYLEDPRGLLFATDILISDVSGVIMDFLPLDRPVIYLDVSDESFWNTADLERGDRAGFCVRNVDELIAAISDSLEKPHRYQGERNRLRSKVFYKLDGHAAERACQAIIQFMN